MSIEDDEGPSREEQVRQAQLLEALDREGEVAQLAALLSQEPVRDLLWRVLSRCHIFGSTYSRVFGDMAHAEGQRNIGLWLLSEIGGADPAALMEMQLKANRLAQVQAAGERKKAARRAPRD